LSIILYFLKTTERVLYCFANKLCWIFIRLWTNK